MPQTRMFRDRVVSMEQTFEGGEKHLDLLKSLCREALPDFEYVSHALDHERDLFVMELAAGDGRRRLVGWTRMVLFDAERIPVLAGDAAGGLRDRIVQYLRARANRPEIVVTFRHLEDGWVDTPEPRRDRRRRRRGRGEAKGGRGEKPSVRPRDGAPPSQPPRREGPPARPAPRAGTPPRGGQPAPSGAQPARTAEGGRPEGRRRRFRRRRRGRGTGGGGSPAPPAATP